MVGLDRFPSSISMVGVRGRITCTEAVSPASSFASFVGDGGSEGSGRVLVGAALRCVVERLSECKDMLLLS